MDDKNFKNKFGKSVAKIRKQNYLTQEQLAEACKISITSLSSIEIGKTFPSSKTLLKIADSLGVEPRQLFDFSENKTVEEKLEAIQRKIKSISKNEAKIDKLHYFVQKFL